MPSTASSSVTILVVGSSPGTSEPLVAAVSAGGWRAVEAAGLEDAFRILQTEVVDVILFDEASPGTGHTADILHRFIAAHADSPLVLISASRESEQRLDALRAGAFQVLTEPVSEDELILNIGRALEHRSLVLQHRSLRQQIFWDSQQTSLVGDSPAMREIRRRIAGCTRGHSAVLIEGEPGTGKELVARILHFAGPRQDQPFVTVRCQAPREILEAEIFGMTRKGFRSAAGPKRGALEEAEGGTLHLDDVGQMDLTVQSALLRALESGSARLASARGPSPIHARVVATSTTRLAGLVRRGRFKPELFDLLRATEIGLPPLRERSEDIPGLARHFLSQHEQRTGKSYTLSSEASLMLQMYDWPGNVDELKGAVEWAMGKDAGGALNPQDFPPEVHGDARRATPVEDLYAGLPSLEGLIKRYISHVLRAARGNKAEAAAVLGISRRRLYRMSARLGQQAPRRKNRSASSPGRDMLVAKG